MNDLDMIYLINAYVASRVSIAVLALSLGQSTPRDILTRRVCSKTTRVYDES